MDDVSFSSKIASPFLPVAAGVVVAVVKMTKMHGWVGH